MHRFIRYFFIFHLCLVLSVLYGQAGTELKFPDGWRAPTESDYSEGNRAFFQGDLPSHVNADFNGDGLSDQAWILLKNSEEEYGLFAFLRKEGGGYKIIALDRTKKQNQYLIMGISIMPAGTYPTACGKGYGRCNEDEPKTIKFIFPSIDYYVFESANSVSYWDSQAQGFKQIWMSD